MTLLKLQIIIIVYTSWSQRQDFFLHIALHSCTDNQDHDQYTMHQFSQVTSNVRIKDHQVPVQKRLTVFFLHLDPCFEPNVIVSNIFYHMYVYWRSPWSKKKFMYQIAQKSLYIKSVPIFSKTWLFKAKQETSLAKWLFFNFNLVVWCAERCHI